MVAGWRFARNTGWGSERPDGAQLPRFRAYAQAVSLPRPTFPDTKPQRVQVARAAATYQVVSSCGLVNADTKPAMLRATPLIGEDAPQLLPFGSSMGNSEGVLNVIRAGIGAGKRNDVSVRPIVNAGHTRASVRLSQGVTDGMLIEPIRPEYPAIAKASRTEGIVVIAATNNRSGKIVGLRVLSGPAMLRRAAEEAVREARYKPYLLNGGPIEVETTISVSFKISS